MNNLIYFSIIGIWFYMISSDFPWNHIYWILTVMLWVYLIFKKSIWILIRNIDNNIKLNWNQNNTNCKFEFNFKVLEILNDKKLEEYFNSDCFEENNNLLKEIISNWKKLIKDWKIKQEVEINIKNWNIYKDWNIKFEDNIYHEIFIPYNLDNYNEDYHHPHTWITIRIIIINGLLKLQLWNFRAWNFNTIYTDSFWNYNYDTYKNFYDLVNIPIIYYFNYLNISKKHLNIVAEWIEWYYNSKGERFSKEWTVKRKQLHIDLNNYFYLNSFWEDDTIDKKYQDILLDFSKKSDNIFNNQNIEINDYRDESSYAFNLWYMTSFSHKYLELKVYDLNEWYEGYKKSSCWYIKEEFIP